jgi:hypothetical protein
MPTPDERKKWREAFELTGPELLRLQMETRRNEFGADYTREAELWLLEKDAQAAAIESKRFQTIRRWSIIGGVAAVVAAIAGLIAAWPVIKEWLRQGALGCAQKQLTTFQAFPPTKPEAFHKA